MAALAEKAAPRAGRTVDEAIDRLLSLAHEHLHMDVAYLAQFVEGQQIIRTLEGDTSHLKLAVGVGGPAEDSYCVRVLSGQIPAAIPDARSNVVTRELPITQELEIGSYVGTPCLGRGGEVEGMLCCMSTGPSPWLDERSVGFLKLISELISDHLQADEPVSAATHPADEDYVRDIIDRSALRIAFQPVVRLEDDEIVGYEALTRFHDGRFPSPAHTFALAARCGLGVELELLAVRRALDHLPDIAEDRGLAVNVSAATVLSPGLGELLLAHADRRLGIELTEHSPVTDYAALDAALTPLRAAGIEVMVDDAGAGYASLRHILLLRPDVIKLDIDVIRGINTDPVRAAMTRSLVSFADEIDAVLVAEGIETFAEHAALLALGVGHGQGYFMARPDFLPAH